MGLIGLVGRSLIRRLSILRVRLRVTGLSPVLRDLVAVRPRVNGVWDNHRDRRNSKIILSKKIRVNRVRVNQGWGNPTTFNRPVKIQSMSKRGPYLWEARGQALEARAGLHERKTITCTLERLGKSTVVVVLLE